MEIKIKGGNEVIGTSEVKKLNELIRNASELGAKVVITGVRVNLGKRGGT